MPGPELGRQVNQLRDFRDRGLLEDVVIEPDFEIDPFGTVQRPGPEDSLPRLVDPHDRSLPLDARAYLSVNCGGCHRFGCGSVPHVHLNLEIATEALEVIGMRPARGDFGMADARVVAPGDPHRSTPWYRLATSGPGRMPQIGPELVDETGQALVREWVASLPVDTADRRLMSKLVKLDEPTVRAEESRVAMQEWWRIARKIAAEAKRKLPTDSDLAEAEAKQRMAADRRQAERVVERERLINELFSTTPRAAIFAVGVGDDALPAATRAIVLDAAAMSDPVIAGLFERYLPPEQRARRLGATISPDTFVAISGDVERGRRLFGESNVLQCRTCHAVAGQGGGVGPALDRVGTRLNRQQLIESLLEPSKVIAPEYRTWIAVTDEGKSFTGLVIDRTKDNVAIVDAAGKRTDLAVATIEQLEPLSTSLMPEQLLRDLTIQEAADLFGHLESLR